MTARAEVVGVVAGDIILTVGARGPVISFLLADDQRALGSSGLVRPSRVAWCQVLCLSQASADAGSALRSGDKVAVHGELKIIRPTPDARQMDAVLVSLVAERLEKLPG